MKLLHRIFFNAIKDELPEKVAELAKPEVAKVLASMKEKHTPEQYAAILKGAYNGLSLFNDAVRDSPNKFDDAGLEIFLEPIVEAAVAEGIEL